MLRVQVYPPVCRSRQHRWDWLDRKVYYDEANSKQSDPAHDGMSLANPYLARSISVFLLLFVWGSDVFRLFSQAIPAPHHCLLVVVESRFVLLSLRDNEWSELDMGMKVAIDRKTETYN